jgi:hypothetical protein
MHYWCWFEKQLGNNNQEKGECWKCEKQIYGELVKDGCKIYHEKCWSERCRICRKPLLTDESKTWIDPLEHIEPSFYFNKREAENVKERIRERKEAVHRKCYKKRDDDDCNIL